MGSVAEMQQEIGVAMSEIEGRESSPGGPARDEGQQPTDCSGCAVTPEVPHLVVSASPECPKHWPPASVRCPKHGGDWAEFQCTVCHPYGAR